MVIRGGRIARVMVRRMSACSGDCENCGFCEEGRPVYTEAYNDIQAAEGQSVVIETETRVVLLSALLVYLLPLAVFLAGYLIARESGVSDLLSLLCAAAAAAASFAGAKFFDRKRAGKPQCTIVAICEDGGTN